MKKAVSHALPWCLIKCALPTRRSQRWLQGVAAERRGVAHYRRLGKILNTTNGPTSLCVWIPPPTQSWGKVKHSPSQASPPRLIRVKQTLAEHQPILHDVLQRQLIGRSLLQLHKQRWRPTFIFCARIWFSIVTTNSASFDGRSNTRPPPFKLKRVSYIRARTSQTRHTFIVATREGLCY